MTKAVVTSSLTTNTKRVGDIPPLIAFGNQSSPKKSASEPATSSTSSFFLENSGLEKLVFIFPIEETLKVSKTFKVYIKNNNALNIKNGAVYKQ